MRAAARLKALSQNLALAGASVLVALAIAELLLRLFFSIPFSMELVHLPDGHVGARLAPNRVYTLKSGGTCTVNNLGFRGKRVVSQEAAPGTFRILALGGSSTFCYQTDDDSLWTALLEKKLRQRYGDAIEVINAGVPGYSVFESKINYLYQLRPLHPDVVIVYHTWNDMKYFHLIEQGIYPKKGVPRGDKMKSFLRKFQIAWRIRNYLHEYVYPRRRENMFDRLSSREKPIERDGPAHRWEKQNYDDLALWLEKDGVVPIFTSQAGLLSESNLSDPEVRSIVYVEYQDLSFEETLKQWHEISRIIETSAKEHDILFLDLYNEVPHTTEYFRDHVHLTDAGNARLADALFDGMSRYSVVDNLIHDER